MAVRCAYACAATCVCLADGRGGAQSMVRDAAFEDDDDGTAMNFEGVANEQDFYDWLKNAYFPAIRAISPTTYIEYA